MRHLEIRNGFEGGYFNESAGDEVRPVLTMRDGA